MVFLKLVLFVTFACFVNADLQEQTFDEENGWQQTATISSLTNIYDGSLKQVAFVNITLATYNYTQDSYQLLTDFVRQKLSDLTMYSEEDHDSMGVPERADDPLPLALDLRWFEVVTTGPSPNLRGVGFQLYLSVYAKKRHHSDVFAAVKNLSL